MHSRVAVGDIWKVSKFPWPLECHDEIGDWRLEIGDWRLEIGDWRLEIGDWRLDGHKPMYSELAGLAFYLITCVLLRWCLVPYQ
ncbi:hypothetical protein BJ875DRAFT_369952 [Amylocarpus encephaloides]|uniref:Uncharacterized protein n=1 Tax=Amylocarpus encephaloides TaxID=45428 RepID=A0A9P7YPT0_9HELO|nr:hypothetical protein BJ875DRAFT_369952 [Amylocarpus encephaloides]